MIALKRKSGSIKIIEIYHLETVAWHSGPMWWTEQQTNITIPWTTPLARQPAHFILKMWSDGLSIISIMYVFYSCDCLTWSQSFIWVNTLLFRAHMDREWSNDSASELHWFSFHLTLIKVLSQHEDLQIHHVDIYVYIYSLHLELITNQALLQACKIIHAIFNKQVKASQNHMTDSQLSFITHRNAEKNN